MLTDEMPPNEGLMYAVAERLKAITGEYPDLFSPVIISNLLSDQVMSAIVRGELPGSVKENPDTGQYEFYPLMNQEQYRMVREAIGPFMARECKLIEKYPEMNLPAAKRSGYLKDLILL